MNQQTITGAGTGHRQGVIPSLLALSVQPKMFLNFTVLHPQLCTCLCCSREATKPTPSANHPVTLQSVSYLTPSLQGFLGNLSATLMFLLIQHSSVVQLPVQLQSTVIPSQGKEIHGTRTHFIHSKQDMAIVPQIQGMDGTDLCLGCIPSTDILEVTRAEGSQTLGQTDKDVFSRHCKAIGSFSYLPRNRKGECTRLPSQWRMPQPH